MAEFFEEEFEEELEEGEVQFTFTGDGTFKKTLNKLCQFFETSSKEEIVGKGVAMLYIFAEAAKENLRPALIDEEGNVVKEIAL